MKKIILSMGIAFSGMAMAQYDGRVGITTTEPMATLDIEANGASKLNGILIPRVTKADAEAMGKNTGNIATNKLQESTMVYITEKDLATTANGQYTSKVDAKGFYYFDGIEWVKVGGGAATGADTSLYAGDGTLASARKVTQNNQDLTFVTGTAKTIVDGKLKTNSFFGKSVVVTDSYEVKDDVDNVNKDVLTIVSKASGTSTIKLPKASDNSGRVFFISNQHTTASTLTVTSESPVIGTPAILQKRGKMVVEAGGEWVVISYN